MKKYLVVGAGINGLTIADRLSAAGHSVTVAERAPVCGGLARTYDYDNGFKFDSGPHWIYINSDEMKNYLDGLLGTELYREALNPGVYFLRKYYNWPLRANVIVKLPPRVALSAFGDLFRVAFSRPKIPDNYAELTLGKFGKTLYELDFRPYTGKFTKTNLEELHLDWSKIGVNRSVDDKPELSSIFSVLKKTLEPKKAAYGWYMHKGIAALPNSIAQRIQKNGGRILTGTEVSDMQVADRTIKQVCLSGQGWQSYDHVIWSASPNELSKILLGQSFQLDFLTNVFYNVMVRGTDHPPYQWLYYVDEDIIFNRLYNTVTFSKTHAPEGCFGYCAEVSCRAGSDVELRPEAYVDTVVKNLVDTCAVRRAEDIIDVRPEVMQRAYPLYTLDYRRRLSSCLNALYSACSNLSLTGRTGLFWYNNIDHSLQNAFDEAKALLEGRRQDIVLKTE